MSLSAGTRLGPYEIVASMGADTYQARDTRLDRAVAIRVVPGDWAGSAELRDRFERNAQRIASLNHPNICKIHDVAVTDSNVPYLVLEHLQGETLAVRLKRGAMPLDEALRIAIAIADALDFAHRHGVVHRDLQPANIMLTSGGPKLIDFGFSGAKNSGTGNPAPLDPGKPPTPITQVGTTIGQLQYLAPEQLEGEEADARTDIFAFGVVLHEMVTGRRAFEAKSQVLLISAIATSDPPAPSRIQPALPPALDHVVRTCLAKDPADRWQSARDLAAELSWIAESGGAAVDANLSASRENVAGGRSLRMMLAAAIALVVLLAIPAALYVRGGPEPERMELRVSSAPVAYSGAPGTQGFFAISPNGSQLLLRSEQGSAANRTVALYISTIDFLNPQRLAGTEDATQPFWSHDGREIAFLVNNKLFKMEATGGPAQPVCDAPDMRGGAWTQDGTILFGSNKGIFRVPASGGKPVAVTTLEPTEAGHFWPAFLPDGRRFLYLSWSAQSENRAVMAGSLDSSVRTRVMTGGTNAVFASGHLIFRRESSLYAQPFDPDALALSGEQARLADTVPHNTNNGRAPFSVSRNGVLAYYRDLIDPTTSASTPEANLDRVWQLVWVARSGDARRNIGKPGVYRGVELSPDGKRVAVHRHDPKGGDVWVLEPGGTETRITFDVSQDNSNPVWSRDGLKITFASLRNGKWALYQAAADGSGQEELLLESELLKVPLQWSPDGQHLLFWVRDPRTQDDLWIWSSSDKKAAPFVATEAVERHGQISPDGKWIAYSSSHTTRNEVFVRPFPTGPGRWQVSPEVPGPDAGGVSGGDWPRWNPKTNELFYLSWGLTDALARTLFVVPWRVNGSAFVHDAPQPVLRFFAVQFPHAGGDYHTYGISPDGQELLVYQTVASETTLPVSETPDPPAGISVILNWLQSVRK